jgi:tetratricopeptide (TPR) repeat protein
MRTAKNKAAFALLALLMASVAVDMRAQTATKPARRSPVTSTSQLPSYASAQVDKAEEAIARGDYAAAEPLLKSAVAADPKDYRAWYDLGFVESNKGDADAAIEAYRKSIALNDKVYESTFNLGVLLGRKGDPESAKFIRAATQLKPTHDVADGQARAWRTLGQLIENDKPQEAVAAYRESARLDPKNSYPHIRAAIVLEKQKDYSAAEAEFKQASGLDPKSSEALAGLVNIYTETHRLPEAETALHRYLAVDASNSAARVQLGRVLAAQGRNDEAVGELEAGMKDSPDPAALRELAGLHAVAKQYDKAASEYRTLIEGNQKDANLHYALGTVLMEQHKFADATQEFVTTVNLKPDLAEAYGSLAVVASENKDYPTTLKALEVRARYLPETPATYFLRATAYDHLRAYKQAAENYHQFLTASNGQNPDREWQARHRLITIEPKK